jgi:hypothetical protein
MSATWQSTESTGTVPAPKIKAKLIVLAAFDRDDEGILYAAFEPREMPDERRAVSAAREMSRRHAGVIAWVREANVAEGEYGDPEVLFQDGVIPDMY